MTCDECETVSPWLLRRNEGWLQIGPLCTLAAQCAVQALLSAGRRKGRSDAVERSHGAGALEDVPVGGALLCPSAAMGSKCCGRGCQSDTALPGSQVCVYDSECDGDGDGVSCIRGSGSHGQRVVGGSGPGPFQSRAEQSRASLHPTPPSLGSICRADAVPLSPAARRCDGTGRDSCHTCTSTAGGITPLDGRGAEGVFWGRKTHAVCPAALRLARGPKFLFLFLFLFPLPLPFTHAWRANRAFKARRALNSAMPSSGNAQQMSRASIELRDIGAWILA